MRVTLYNSGYSSGVTALSTNPTLGGKRYGSVDFSRADVRDHRVPADQKVGPEPVARPHGGAARLLPGQVVDGAADHQFHDERFHHAQWPQDRKSTRLNSSHLGISYAVFCLKKKIEK